MSEKTITNPLHRLWLQQYPFSYWDNRLEKINPYNPEDRLEALFVLLQLTDLYTHIFSVKVRNPDQPWFLVKEKTMSYDIRDTLDKLTEARDFGEYIFTEKLSEEPEGLIEFDRVLEGWEVTKEDWIAIDLLGCPVEFDTKAEDVVYHEAPESHYIGANAILNFWDENRPLLNDFKHGFRVLPFNAGALQTMLDYGLEESEEVEEVFDKLRSAGRDEWEQYFVRLSTEESNSEDWYDYLVSVHLHRANIDACHEFSRLTFRQLHNLFGKGGDYHIEPFLNSLMSRAEAEEPDTIQLIDHVAEFKVEYVP